MQQQRLLQQQNHQQQPPHQQQQAYAKGTNCVGRDSEYYFLERRPSREDGSDSIKDSSFQSDTSVDSEDSFASVIYVPNANSNRTASSPGLTEANASLSSNSTPASSPRFKYPPGSGPISPTISPGSQRIKLMSPLLKQFPSPLSPTSLTPPLRSATTPKTFFDATDANATPGEIFYKTHFCSRTFFLYIVLDVFLSSLSS